MFAILCDARDGRDKGIRVLALVDRSKERRLWWTSDRPGIIRSYGTRQEADEACKKLGRNNPRVVGFEEAKARIRAQADHIKEVEEDRLHLRLMDEEEMGWDAHKTV